MADKEAVSDVIRRIVADAGKVLGSKLAMDLKEEVPDWNAVNYGARNLRDFIVTNVDGVMVLGRSGMDLIYGRSTENPSAQATVSSPSSPPDKWRAWVSPNSPFALAFDADDGSVVLIGRHAPTPEGRIRVDPATADDHREIAQNYIEQAPQAAHEELRAVVESPDDQWWRHWMLELNKLNEVPAWNRFRHEKLRALLESRLKDHGFDATTRAAAVRTVTLSRQQRPRGKAPSSPRAPTHNDLRMVVTAVIQRMAAEDLRSLKLPVGLVIDVIDEMKS